MYCTVFPSDSISTGKRFDVAWDDLAQTLCHDPQSRETPKKALALWCPTAFKGDHRSRADVEGVYALGFDVDEDPIPTESELRSALCGQACLFHLSSSATPAAPRWRLLLQLSRAVTGAEYDALWARVARALPFPVGAGSKDPSRGWYVPREPAEGDFLGVALKGQPLDVDATLATIEPAGSAKAVQPAPAIASTDVRRTAAAKLLASAWPPVGTRHAAKIALAGGLWRDGFPEIEALAFLRDVYTGVESADGGKIDREVRATYASAATKNVTGWNTLSTLMDSSVVSAARDLLKSDPMREAHARFEGSNDTGEIFPLTDSGNAERFAAQHKGSVRFVADWNRWLTWDGTRWQPDKTGAVARLAKKTARAINREIDLEDDDDRRKKVRAWASKTEGRQGRENMIVLARSEQGIAAIPGDFDADLWLLNVTNGTLNLRTMELRPHAREDMITKLAPVAYDPNAKAPLWEAFLARVMAENEALIAYLQRLVGYALTGSIREQIFTFSHGSGGNGKGVFHHTIDRMLGDYAVTAADNLFFVSKGDGGHPTSTATLFGARFVLCSEIPDDKRFNEQLLKNMTGGDVITTRRLYENEWEYTPTGKLFFCGNHKPIIRGTDDGIWRRVRLIPWTVQIPKGEVDPDLESKLEAELPGILAWAVRGCAAWRDHGLGDAPDVERASAAYREESDPMADFFRTRCEFGDGFKVSRAALRRAYEAWCTEQGATPFGARKVGDALRRRGVVDGGTTWDSLVSAPADAWRGIRLRDRSAIAA